MEKLPPRSHLAPFSSQALSQLISFLSKPPSQSGKTHTKPTKSKLSIKPSSKNSLKNRFIDDSLAACPSGDLPTRPDDLSGKNNSKNLTPHTINHLLTSEVVEKKTRDAHMPRNAFSDDDDKNGILARQIALNEIKILECCSTCHKSKLKLPSRPTTYPKIRRSKLHDHHNVCEHPKRNPNNSEKLPRRRPTKPIPPVPLQIKVNHSNPPISSTQYSLPPSKSANSSVESTLSSSSNIYIIPKRRLTPPLSRHTPKFKVSEQNSNPNTRSPPTPCKSKSNTNYRLDSTRPSLPCHTMDTFSQNHDKEEKIAASVPDSLRNISPFSPTFTPSTLHKSIPKTHEDIKLKQERKENLDYVDENHVLDVRRFLQCRDFVKKVLPITHGSNGRGPSNQLFDGVLAANELSLDILAQEVKNTIDKFKILTQTMQNVVQFCRYPPVELKKMLHQIGISLTPIRYYEFGRKMKQIKIKSPDAWNWTWRYLSFDSSHAFDLFIQHMNSQFKSPLEREETKSRIQHLKRINAKQRLDEYYNSLKQTNSLKHKLKRKLFVKRYRKDTIVTFDLAVDVLRKKKKLKSNRPCSKYQPKKRSTKLPAVPIPMNDPKRTENQNKNSKEKRLSPNDIRTLKQIQIQLKNLQNQRESPVNNCEKKRLIKRNERTCVWRSLNETLMLKIEDAIKRCSPLDICTWNQLNPSIQTAFVDLEP